MLRVLVEDLHLLPPLPELRWFKERGAGDPGPTVWAPKARFSGFSDETGVWVDANVKDAHELARILGHETWHWRGHHYRFSGAEARAMLEHDAEDFARRFAASSTVLALRKARIPASACRVVHGRPIGLTFEPLDRALQTRVSSGGSRRIPDRILRCVERAAEGVRVAIGLVEALRGQAEAPQRYESRSGEPRCGYYGNPY
jgi:hypothetical protein